MIGDDLIAEGWYHEDIYDPGDMQRVDVQMSIRDGKLRMRWHKRYSGEYSDDEVIAPVGFHSTIAPDEQADYWWIDTYTPIID